ncbi:hypothetical protein CDHC01_0723 [Corynebacterium diphtheriae HC01]|uniref:Uncharacterized protein n=2 Tax=Corynebacterium diphtheriae TaxID=1717 RepID=Q6NIH7_CORDI|nr:hypothetical protein [Corynebacterium diphtheriae]AEX41510.1 hypothetical protein CD31A_0831 [Corynebacterium diphtheriae 31A]AEX43790.1 hypothetical protein CD241_0723 [Corynebacterium diphtheriae 241]AEX73976.1 hypothetical protein CDHC01_0723 [Corynebacterium diphtheriae HC01]AEX78451.1 hypothetical protein CDHC03_0720 [Corynebacterium diphtheriae HC03]ARB87002.1 hypothetical protein A6J36_00765 [Corynebacterium diphtheriae]
MDFLLAQRKDLSRVDDELEFFLNNRSAVVVVDASVLPFLRHSWEELGAVDEFHTLVRALESARRLRLIRDHPVPALRKGTASFSALAPSR